MSSLPITPPKARVDLAPKSSSPPTGSPGFGDFAALLSQTTARTAPAEGQQTRPARSEQPRRRDDDGQHARRAQTNDDDNSSSAAQAQQADAQRPASDATQSKPDGQPAASQDGAAQDQATAQQQGQQGADAQTTAAAVAPATTPLTGATTGASTDAKAADASAKGKLAPALVQAGDAAGQPVVTDGAVTPDGTPAGKLQIPAELLSGKAAGRLPHAADASTSDGATGDLPPMPTLPPSANASPAGTTPGGAGDPGANHPNNHGGNAQAQPSPAPAPTAGQATQAPFMTTPTATTGTPQLTRTSLAQTAERVQELVRIATNRAGNARATLQLKPEALGQVDVQLRTTRDGLVATIAAHDQAGLDALQNAAAELRRTLQDSGVELHSLDLQLGGGAESGFSNQGDAREASTGRSGQASSYGLDDGEDAGDETELTITRTPSIPAGELVDVTA